MDTTLGPIQLLVIGFPDNDFNGQIVPEIRALIQREVISVIDGILIRKEADGSTTTTQFDELGWREDNVTTFSPDLEARIDELLSGPDIQSVADELDPNSSVAVLVFEDTWVKKLRDAISGSGGVMLREVRASGQLVEEIVAGLTSPA